ncbi:peptidase M16 [Rhodobaculum claviforme]|uniref:Peptidase M16 n=2 Tax=Rhodobaculum claviforme TaxID=1549854 RepID=A0A934TN07_9RHOB|nr:peptidase M16 [Rhodobaculum claviforme]
MATAAGGPVAAAAGTGDVARFTLDNGMDVVVIEDARAPAVVHMVWYPVGAADEPPGQSGIAHFLEHLMFKGTDTRAPGEFSAVVEQLGGRDNAFTSWDYTAYFQRTAAEHLPILMEMEADRMANLAFTEAEWLPERDVILEERGQVVESRPGALFSEQMRAALFTNHPYGTPIIGWRHEMATLTGDNAMDFHAAHYGPNAAILLVAGDVRADEVLALAQQHYGTIPANPAITTPARPQEPPHLAARRIEMTDPRVAQPYVMRQYLAPARRPGDQADAAALSVLAELLGGSRTTSVLARTLVQAEDAPALSVSAWYSGLARDDGTFTLAIVPAEGVDLATAEAALDDAVAAFMEAGVDPEQFARVRTRIRAAEIFARDSVEGRARTMGTALSTGLEVADVEGWTDALMAVTPEQVMAAAQSVFDRTRSVTGWLQGPPDAHPTGPATVEPPMTEVMQ